MLKIIKFYCYTIKFIKLFTFINKMTKNCKDPNKEKRPDKNGKLRCMSPKKKSTKPIKPSNTKCKDPNKQKILDKNGKLRCMSPKKKPTIKPKSPAIKPSKKKPTIKPTKTKSIIIPELFDYSKSDKIIVETDSLEHYYGSLYLAYKYSDQCIIIPFNKTYLKKSIDWEDLTLTYDQRKNSLIYPKNFWIYFNKCLTTSKRFIIIPFGYDCIDNSGHANMLVYDKLNNEIERFEPNGYMYNFDCIPSNIDDALKAAFKANVNYKIKYFKPIDFCPDFNFQKIAAQEKIGDSGYCIFWSLWYADLRLSNPDINREEIINKAIKSLGKKGYFNLFIRRYAKFIADLTYKIKVDKNPDKQFLCLLKKIKNNNIKC